MDWRWSSMHYHFCFPFGSTAASRCTLIGDILKGLAGLLGLGGALTGAGGALDIGINAVAALQNVWEVLRDWLAWFRRMLDDGFDLNSDVFADPQYAWNDRRINPLRSC